MIARAQQQAEALRAQYRAKLHPGSDGGAEPEGEAEAPPGHTEPQTPQPPADSKPELQPAFETAVQFFQGIVDWSRGNLVVSVRAPFYFEGKEVTSIDEVRKRWARALAGLGTGPMVLYGIELLSWDEMVKKYGKPPERLSEIPSKGAMVAVANINGQPKVAVLHKEGNGTWQVFAFHD